MGLPAYCQAHLLQVMNKKRATFYRPRAAPGDFIDGIFILMPWWSDCDHTTLLRTKSLYFSLLPELITCGNCMKLWYLCWWLKPLWRGCLQRNYEVPWWDGKKQLFVQSPLASCSDFTKADDVPMDGPIKWARCHVSNTLGSLEQSSWCGQWFKCWP